MTSPAGSLAIVSLGEVQIATIPLINHPSLSLLEVGRRQPIHPPHFKTFFPDSSTGIDPDSISDNGSDDYDQGKWQQHSPSPALSVSHLAAGFVQRIGTFVPLHCDHLCEAMQSWKLKRRGSTTMVVERQKPYSREAQQRRLVEDCASPPLRPDLRLCLAHSPRLIPRKSRLALLIGGLLRGVGLRLRKTLRHLIHRLYWTQRQGITIKRRTPKARKRRRRKTALQTPQANSPIQHS